MTIKERIKALATGQMSFDAYADHARSAKLTELTLDVGRTCTLTCAGMCYRADRARPTRAEEYVDFNIIEREVRVAEKDGLQNLTISGTEPFLYLDHDTELTRLATRRTYEILETFGTKPRHFRLGLISNGLNIHRHWDALASLAKRGSFDYIDLSIDSGDPASHDRIRGRKGAGAAVLAASIEAHRRLAGVRICTSSVLRPDNATGILHLIREQSRHNHHFFVTPIHPLSIGKGVRPITPETVIRFVRSLETLLNDPDLQDSGAEVTMRITGLYIYDLITAGIFHWDEVQEIGNELFVIRHIGGNTLILELRMLPSYGLNLGLLEFTGDYLPHGHALQLPHEARKQWVTGNVRNHSLKDLHSRGTNGLIQELIRARTTHDCRNQPCWNTCFGGMAFNMEDAALQGQPLTIKPTACVRTDFRRLPIVL